MKKIFAILGVVFGAIFLAGCANQTAPTANTQSPVVETLPPVSPSVKAPVNSSLPDNAVTSLPTTPAKTSDVDSSLNQLDKDLNSVDAAAPNVNDLNGADLQK